MRTSNTGSSETSGVLNECHVWVVVVQYAVQVLTLSLILGIALKISRWEQEHFTGRRR